MKKKAIVVDDQLTLVRLVAAFLKMMNWDVFEFSNPQDVVDAVTEINPRVDLLITDFKMPQMNGAELINKIKEKKPDIKVICMSGFDIKNACDISICNSFLLKPFGFKIFKEEMNKLFPPQK